MTELSRRNLLRGTGAAAIVSALGARGAAAGTAPAHRRAVRTTGTTLDSVATPVGSTGYRSLRAGPGWPLVPRRELAPGRAGRDDRRTALASFVQLTDLHIGDVQSPMRFEYLHPLINSAFRPQEALAPLGAAALMRRVNDVARGPFTGRAFDMVVCTGDNTDNNERAELDWYLAVLNGGTITPNTGDRARYEGVQNSGAALYWNPEIADADMYTDAGFPHVPGFLDAAIRPFRSPGLRTPWYSTFGNHDNSVVGTLPGDNPVLEAIYLGDRKIEGMSDVDSTRLASALRRDRNTAIGMISGGTGPVRTVTPDQRRSPLAPREHVHAHLLPENTGPGPRGHGYGENNLADDTAYYTFRIAPGVLGISLDSTNRAGFTDGSLGTAQLEWLEEVLVRNSSRYYDTDGTPTRHEATDELMLVFSHHTSETMGNLLPAPDRPLEQRHGGGQLVELLQRFPNLLAWVNGHTHANRIIPHGAAEPERAFWEINTASHIDHPQHARIIEVADNRDGTLSLFTTLIESAAGYRADYGDLSQDGLGALYRELAFNDIHATPDKVGGPGDRNAELLLPRPGPPA